MVRGKGIWSALVSVAVLTVQVGCGGESEQERQVDAAVEALAAAADGVTESDALVRGTRQVAKGKEATVLAAEGNDTAEADDAAPESAGADAIPDLPASIADPLSKSQDAAERAREE